MGQQGIDFNFEKDAQDKPVQPADNNLKVASNLNLLSVSSIPEKSLSAQELEQLANRFDDACNGGLTGIGTDFETVLDVLSKVPENQMTDFDQAFRKLHDKDWGVAKELDDELESHDLAIANNLFNARTKEVEFKEFFNGQRLHNFETEMHSFLDGITGGESKVEPLSLRNISKNSKYTPFYNQFEKLSEEPHIDGARREQVMFDALSPDKRRRLAAEILETEEARRFYNPLGGLSDFARMTVRHTDEYEEFANVILESRDTTERTIRMRQEQFKMMLPEDAKRDLDAHTRRERIYAGTGFPELNNKRFAK